MSITDLAPPPFVAIETPRLRLRHFDAGDLATLVAYRNDPDVARYQSWTSFTAEAAQAFIAEMRMAQPGIAGTWFQFAIERREASNPGLHIGDCALHTLADDARLGEIGYTLATAHQGQGYAREAVSAMLDHAFNSLHMHRITASVDTQNAPSIALLERLHFRREGHFIQCGWYNGGWCDEYLYAMLRTGWKA